MRTIIVAWLMLAAATASSAQTSAKEFFDSGHKKSFEAYGKDATPEAADAAIADFNEAIKLQADHHEAYNFRANMKFHKNDLAETDEKIAKEEGDKMMEKLFKR